ncbi:MAG: hypothetical protein U5R06_13130 [candidate division KSB1 bacterium]|nr:hypothetical protein [candidate division KSB1 bacterium]
MKYFTLTLFLLGTSLSTKAKPEIPQYTWGDLSAQRQYPKSCKLLADNGVTWCLFVSNYLGFYEFWAANSTDGENWSQALYTGIPLLPRKNISARVTLPHFIVQYDSVEKRLSYLDYLRNGSNADTKMFRVTKSALLGDSDLDGWSDLVESRIWTDLQNADTDGDGVIDRFDSNPLAAEPDTLTLEQRLHKYIIEQELGLYDTHQLVIVEQTHGSMQYKRQSGLILSLPPEDCDEWIQLYGPGVPIITCHVGRHQ